MSIIDLTIEKPALKRTEVVDADPETDETAEDEPVEVGVEAGDGGSRRGPVRRVTRAVGTVAAVTVGLLTLRTVRRRRRARRAEESAE